MNRVVSVLGKVTHNGSGWLLSHLDPETVVKFAGFPVAMPGCQRCWKVGCLGGYSVLPGMDSTEKIARKVFRHMGSDLVIQNQWWIAASIPVRQFGRPTCLQRRCNRQVLRIDCGLIGRLYKGHTQVFILDQRRKTLNQSRQRARPVANRQFTPQP